MPKEKFSKTWLGSIILMCGGLIAGNGQPVLDWGNEDLVVQFRTELAKKALLVREVDPYIPWSVMRAGVPKVWTKTKGNVPVCVVNSGITPTHPQLKGRVFGGYNVLGKNARFEDREGIGTEVAGVIVGVAPEAQLYAVKVVEGHERRVSPAAMAAGIEWCIEHGIRIINISIGINREDAQGPQGRILEQVIASARHDGAIIITAAGSDRTGQRGVGYPSRFPESITITSSNMSDWWEGDRLANQEGAGPEVDFIAPGYKIVTTNLDRSYIKVSGSAFAAAHVAGLAALYLATHELASADEIKVALKQAARPLPDLPPIVQGHGLIEAPRLLELP